MSDIITEKLHWYQNFAPSTITFHNIRTGEQVREPSLIALDAGGAGKGKLPPFVMGGASVPLPMEQCRAAGSAALDYRNDSSVVVFSPLRNGQIADYTASQHLFRELYRRVRSGPAALIKPVLCVHTQKHTTEVEELALIDAGIQMGARQVFLYQDSFSAMLDKARSDPKLRNGYILHIEPQDE